MKSPSGAPLTRSSYEHSMGKLTISCSELVVKIIIQVLILKRIPKGWLKNQKNIGNDPPLDHFIPSFALRGVTQQKLYIFVWLRLSSPLLHW